MLEYERALLVGMASEANRILRRRGPHLLWPDRSVRIMEIGALDQTLVYAMVKGHFELGLLLQMARVTKFGWCFHQQKLLWFANGEASGRRCN